MFMTFSFQSAVSKSLFCALTLYNRRGGGNSSVFCKSFFDAPGCRMERRVGHDNERALFSTQRSGRAGSERVASTRRMARNVLKRHNFLIEQQMGAHCGGAKRDYFFA